MLDGAWPVEAAIRYFPHALAAHGLRRGCTTRGLPIGGSNVGRPVAARRGNEHAAPEERGGRVPQAGVDGQDRVGGGHRPREPLALGRCGGWPPHRMARALARWIRRRKMNLGFEALP